MSKVLIDLFCKAGGATKGYQRAGFYVIGVDIEPQPNYCGDEFVQADAMTHYLAHCDAIHASPPCQADLKGLASVNRKRGREYRHRSLLRAVRDLLDGSTFPYIIEQPEQGAQMVKPVRCCGSSFGLPVRRHRLFESNIPLVAPPCNHKWQATPKYWTGWRPNGQKRLANVVQVYGNGANQHEWGPALGVDWMTPDELTQAIPPAYTEFLGRQLMAYLTHARAA